MAGLLSSMFHPDGGSDHHPADLRGADHVGTSHEQAQNGSASDSSDDHGIGGHADMNPSVSFHTEMNGSMDTMDGSTHSWSDTQDVSATADADAVFGATQSYQADHFDT